MVKRLWPQGMDLELDRGGVVLLGKESSLEMLGILNYLLLSFLRASLSINWILNWTKTPDTVPALVPSNPCS